MMQRQLLEGQGEMLRAIGPDEIATATRGSAILVRDDLEPWRQTVEDPESYSFSGMESARCAAGIANRNCQMSCGSNRRRRPIHPPISGLEAGAKGVDVRYGPLWLIRRPWSNDRPTALSWTAVTDEPVDGEGWRDESAPQGHDVELSVCDRWLRCRASDHGGRSAF